MEREIQIAGHWLIFALILGMVLSMCGITGTIIGYAYTNPLQAAAHPVLFPLARVSVILGPIVLFSGVAMFLGSIIGMRRHQGTPTLAMAPIDYKSLKRVAIKAMDEEEAQEEMPEISMGWRKSY